MIDYEMVAFVEAIRQTCRVALLTNAPGPFFRNLLSDYSLADLFDPIVVSSEIGHAKPEPEIYLALLEQAGVQAAQSILLDDNPANVEGALRCGMDAILFSSLDQVRKMIGQQ
jgi:putative hydrolase of the HAD superfamily